MFHGYYDGNRLKSITAKATEAVAEFRAKYKCDPTVMLTSYANAATLEETGFTREIGIDLQIRPVTFIGRDTIYTGIE